MIPMIVVGVVVLLALALSADGARSVVRSMAPLPAPARPRPPPAALPAPEALALPDRGAIPRRGRPRYLRLVRSVDHAQDYASGGFHAALDAAEQAAVGTPGRDDWIRAANLYAGAFRDPAQQVALSPAARLVRMLEILRAANRRADVARVAFSPSVLLPEEMAAEAAAATAPPPAAPAEAAGEAARPTGSPWPDVPAAAWRDFCRRLVARPPGHVAPDGKLGMFLFDPRRLEVLGVMHNVRREDGRLVGDFRAPLTGAIWLGSAKIQLRTLRASMAKLRPVVERDHGTELGREHAGHRATLSGLLGTAHAAGISRLGSWLGSDDDKARYPHTTVAFLHTNGLF